MPASPNLNVSVMGAGAVGCFYGGMLARAGHHVTLIARPQHVAAIRAQGLRMETKMFDERVPLAASSDAAAVAGADVVLLCVKSMDTQAAGAQMKPFLRSDTLVLCLQNGVDNADRLRTVLPAQPIGSAVVYVGSEMAGPGHLKHHGRGELVIDPIAGSERIAEAFRAAGVQADISPNVRGALWLKLVLNCTYNAVSAIAQRPYGECVTGVGMAGVLEDLVSECLAVAAAEGVELTGDARAAGRQIIASMPTQYSSTAQDLARGKPSEIDFLNGFIVRRGEERGVATPVNRAMWALVKLLESKHA